MNEPRPLALVDGELRTLVSLQHDATQQLASIRRQITELQCHELSVIASVDMRNRKIDRLLDQRLDTRDAVNAALEAKVTA